MKLLSETIRLHLKVYLYYRWAFFISIIIDPVMLVLIISIFTTIYTNGQQEIILGYSCTQMIWYFAAVRFYYALAVSYSDNELSQDILSGNMIVRLIKPIHVMKWFFSKSAANKIFAFFLEFLPSFFIFLMIVYPDFLTWLSFIKYLLLMIPAFILFFLISFLIGTTGFLLKSISALQMVKAFFLQFVSGAFLPIDFLPETARRIIGYMPFQYICYIPARFLLNMPETAGWGYFLHVLAVGGIWIVILYILCRIYWLLMIKKFTAVGC